MKIRRIIAYAAVWMSVSAFSQPQINFRLSGRPDSTLIRDAAILGAHDAATGHGFAGLKGMFASPFAATQSRKIAELWALGVRAFDLRPAMRGKEVWIYHGPMRTRLRLADALEIIARGLEAEPREVAVILLRREATSEEWTDSVAAVFSRSRLRLAEFSDSITLGQARGRVLVLTRDSIPHPGIALIRGWGHGEVTNARIGSARVSVQDMFDCTASGALERKCSLMLRAAERQGWVINHMSGFTKARSASSSRKVSEQMFRLLLDSVAEPHGIIMVDFIE